MTKQKDTDADLRKLPPSAAQFITLVIKKMRYRKKVRADVAAELTAHFEDALKDCKTGEEKDLTAQQLIADFGDAGLLAVLLRRAKKRCRPLWRTVAARTFQTIALLILCFIAYCAHVSLGKPTITVNYVREATNLTRPVVDESLNAAPLYQKAINAYKEPPNIQIEPEVSRPVSADYALTSENIAETLDLLKAIGDKRQLGDLSQEQLSLLEQWLAANAQAIEFFRRASDRPHCWWQRRSEDNILIVTPMPELAPIRKLVIMIAWHAKLKAHNKCLEDAFDHLLACYRAGMHLKGPRPLIEQLVAIAVQSLSVRNAFVILRNYRIDPQLLKHFQAQLQNLENRDSFVLNYEAERFFGADFIQRCYTDNGRGSGHMIPGRIKGYLRLIEYDMQNDIFDYVRCLAASLAGADRDRMTAQFDSLYDTAQEWAHKTPWQLREDKVDPDMGVHKWSSFKQARYWPVLGLAPAAARASTHTHRRKAEIQALITTIALLRYNQQHGAYPERLNRLVEAGLLTELPMDPYSHEPLLYEKVEDHFLLYSIGENFKDDGGEVFRDDKARVSQWAEQADAVFWPVLR